MDSPRIISVKRPSIEREIFSEDNLIELKSMLAAIMPIEAKSMASVIGGGHVEIKSSNRIHGMGKRERQEQNRRWAVGLLGINRRSLYRLLGLCDGF